MLLKWLEDEIEMLVVSLNKFQSTPFVLRVIRAASRRVFRIFESGELVDIDRGFFFRGVP